MESRGYGREVAGSSSRDAVMHRYKEQAQRRRAGSLSLKRKCVGSSVPEMQIQVCVGRSELQRGRRKIDRVFGAVKINVHKGASYSRLLEKCRNAVWGDIPEDDKYSYTLLDSQGLAIDDKLIIDHPDGVDRELPWNLETYVKVTKKAYSTQPKFIVLRTPVFDDAEVCDTPNVDVPKQKSDVLNKGHVDQDMQAKQGEQPAKNVQMEDSCSVFTPLFISCTYSKYDEEKVVWRANVTQEDALGFLLKEGNDEIMEGVQAAIIDNPDNEMIVHPINPCHHGFIFSGFQLGDVITELVFDVKRHSLVYGPKRDGATFEITKQCQNSSDGSAVCMMCVALHGYHNHESTYVWSRNSGNCWIVLDDEIYPVVYTHLEGKFICRVQSNSHEAVGTFHVARTVEGTLLAEIYDGEMNDHSYNVEENSENVSTQAEVCGNQFQETDFMNPNCVRLVKVIGRGTYGVVHKAVWRGSIVAVKQISTPSNNPENSHLIKEIEAFQNIQHPNILCLLGTIRNDSSLMIVTNYVEGMDLQTIIFNKTVERMSFEKKIRISVQISQALIFLHTAIPPTVHLDVKPANILVQRSNNHVFLADFVLGTKTIQAGTPGFQAPEQLRAEPIDVGADVYAFGALLVELFGEKALWGGLTPYQIIVKVAINDEVPDCSQLPASIKIICEMCMKPKHQRSSIADVLKALLHAS